ncbi:protein BatD [Candidatus Bathyarchaeota archaeon]|nr:protein BatD [Candidatus Bathyarchaeota archaeon]
MTVKEAFAVLIIILLASTLMAFQPVEATFTPAIPQFTLAIVNHAYDEPTTYTTNQFTGVTTSHGGTHYEWKTLDITITNQPVTTDGQNSLRYNIRFKGQYTEQWTENNGEGAFYPQNSSSSTTLFSYFLGGSYPGAPGATSQIAGLPDGTKVSFQVRALWGYDDYDFTYGLRSYRFYTVSSSYSDIQTITLGSGEVTVEQGTASVTTPAPIITAEPTNNPTTKPTIDPTMPQVTPQDHQNTPQGNWPTLSWEQIVIAVMAMAIAVLAVGLAVLWRRLPRK